MFFLGWPISEWLLQLVFREGTAKKRKDLCIVWLVQKVGNEGSVHSHHKVSGRSRKKHILAKFGQNWNNKENWKAEYLAVQCSSILLLKTIVNLTNLILMSIACFFFEDGGVPG